MGKHSWDVGCETLKRTRRFHNERTSDIIYTNTKNFICGNRHVQTLITIHELGLTSPWLHRERELVGRDASIQQRGRRIGESRTVNMKVTRTVKKMNNQTVVQGNRRTVKVNRLIGEFWH